MSGYIYLLLSASSLLFWKINTCTVCNELDVGFLNYSWYLWGALYYSIAGTLAFKFKKSWYTGIIMIGGTSFHITLLFYGYAFKHSLCLTCLAFLILEITAMLVYAAEDHAPVHRMLVLGLGKSMVAIALAFFILHPAAEVKPVQKNEIAVKTTTPAVAPAKNIVQQDGEKPVVSFGPKIKVQTPDGKNTEIDLSLKPAIFFAWWCSHCDDALQEAAKLVPDERPYLVVVFNKGTGDKEGIENKLARSGLKGSPYYVYNEHPPIDGVPTTVWWTDGKYNSMVGYTSSIKANAPELLGKARILIGRGPGAVNASLAAKAFDGHIVAPGEVFSFNQTVGERTADKGYQISGVVESDGNGGYRYGQGIGGGVCRTSTVLHWAVKNAGLEVVETHRHSLPVAYGENGDDSAVAWPTWDYKFRNNTTGNVKLKSIIDGTWLEVQLWKE